MLCATSHNTMSLPRRHILQWPWQTLNVFEIAAVVTASHSVVSSLTVLSRFVRPYCSMRSLSLSLSRSRSRSRAHGHAIFLVRVHTPYRVSRVLARLEVTVWPSDGFSEISEAHWGWVCRRLFISVGKFLENTANQWDWPQPVTVRIGCRKIVVNHKR
jgi:hypothetical protein